MPVFMMSSIDFYLYFVAELLGQIPASERQHGALLLLENLNREPENAEVHYLAHTVEEWRTYFDAIHSPAFALSFAGIGQSARLTRANMVETYRKPFIEMAMAFGFPQGRISRRFAFKPSMIPSLTVIGLDLASMLGNAFLVEQIFAWPGLSRYGVAVILRKDLNAIVGTVLIGKVLTRELLVAGARHMGVRLTSQQVAKFVPVAGQAAAALIGYTALRYMGELHIKDCVQVCLAAQNLLAGPSPSTALSR